MGQSMKIAKSQNASNEYIAQMNNEYNKAQFDKQIAYNWEMFQKSNEYNTPSNQAARLRAAGINPYVAGLDGSTPAASGLGVNPPTASEVGKHDVAAMVDAYNNDKNRGLQVADQLNQSAMQMANATKTIEETKGIQIENMYKEQKLKNSLYESYGRGRNVKLQNDYQQIINDVAKANQPYDAVKSQLQNAQTEEITRFYYEQASNEVIKGLMLDKEYLWMDKINNEKIKNIVADTFLKAEQKNLTAKQVSTEIAKKLKIQAEKVGIDKNNEILKKTSDEIVQQTILTTKSMQGDYDTNNTYNDVEFVNKVWTRPINTILGPVRSALSPVLKAVAK